VDRIEVPREASPSGELWKWSLGLSYAHIVKALREIRSELGWNIRGFSEMSVAEISTRTGLDKEASRLAAMREFDEPFITDDQPVSDEDLLLGAAARRGLTVSRGGRFYHLHGDNDKGCALEKVVAWYNGFHQKVVSVALGDSPNDFSMLEQADIPVLVKTEHAFPDLRKRIPELKVTQEMGPKGWNKVVLEILGRSEENLHE
jgi:mannosyl-3-phosphoglycerate phosphatase